MTVQYVEVLGLAAPSLTASPSTLATMVEVVGAPNPFKVLLKVPLSIAPVATQPPLEVEVLAARAVAT